MTSEADNERTWDHWAEAHLLAFGRRIAQLSAGRCSITEIESDLLRPFAGKRIVHLQCHIGLDAIALALMGFERIIGIDRSVNAIDIAKKLACQMSRPDVRFMCLDASRLPAYLDGVADVVFVNTGSLCWINDLDQYFRSAVRILASGGHIVIFDIHPLVNASLPNATPITLGRPYFYQRNAHTSTQNSSYATDDLGLEFVTHQWNHSLSEIYASARAAGLAITDFREYSASAWRAFPWLVESSELLWAAPAGMPQAPLSFSMTWKKLTA